MTTDEARERLLDELEALTRRIPKTTARDRLDIRDSFAESIDALIEAVREEMDAEAASTFDDLETTWAPNQFDDE